MLISKLMQVLESSDVKVGFNASTGTFEDMFAAGIIDPTKVRVKNSSHCTLSLLLHCFRQAKQADRFC